MEAPPGFEPGVEVLQTSALPLGDGAPADAAKTGLPPEALGLEIGQPTFARGAFRSRALVGTFACNRERRVERETGFEPATSTLARSHSTTELFPLEPPTYHHNRTERKTLAASSGGVGLM